ncbi:MAG: circularly permuted type 2 ATP-grasp protein, partial [Pseudomonadota bacterium]
VGIAPPGGVRIHVAGVDLVRDGNAEWRVLEDNCRVPSGVSYVVENRALMLRTMPDVAQGVPLRPVGDYGQRLRQSLAEVAPEGVAEPRIAVLTPGVFNSAYFEHVFLAREMGAELVEGRDLVIENDRVFRRTVAGLRPIHVIYRRIDDDFLDPEVFRKDSVLGVPGLMRAWAKGNVTIANAAGCGIADDKAVYAYLPEIIRYYLSEEPILKNVETYSCADPEQRAYVLAHLEELVSKPVDGSGGYGVVIGPNATEDELAETRAAIAAQPEKYIAQPFLNLSVCPTVTEDGVRARHVDLRPFVVTGKTSWTLPGGLTRVALRKGSSVVNSSQGGGSKDTWVVG